MTEPANIVGRVELLRRKGLTPERAARRKVVDARNTALQAGPIKRGPGAHPDGTFGKVKT